MASLKTGIKYLLNSLLDPRGKDLLVIPDKIKNDLSASLRENEEIVMSLKTERAIYRAGSARDSNTFYKTYALFTNARVVLVKDSSRLKIFREFPLNQVNSLLYEEVNNKPTIHVGTVSSRYILTMPPRSFEESKIFFDKFKETYEKNSRETENCSNCGNKIPQDSVYCSQCGKKIN